MDLQIYDDELYSIQIDRYQHDEGEQPHQLVASATAHEDRYAIAISDERGKLVGFMGLQIGYQSKNHGLVQGLSIDKRHKGKGYDANCFSRIFEFINEEICEHITTLIVGVPEENQRAQKTYAKANFKPQEKRGNLIMMKKTKEVPPCS